MKITRLLTRPRLSKTGNYSVPLFFFLLLRISRQAVTSAGYLKALWPLFLCLYALICSVRPFGRERKGAVKFVAHGWHHVDMYIAHKAYGRQIF